MRPPAFQKRLQDRVLSGSVQSVFKVPSNVRFLTLFLWSVGLIHKFSLCVCLFAQQRARQDGRFSFGLLCIRKFRIETAAIFRSSASLLNSVCTCGTLSTRVYSELAGQLATTYEFANSVKAKKSGEFRRFELPSHSTYSLRSTYSRRSAVIKFKVTKSTSIKRK